MIAKGESRFVGQLSIGFTEDQDAFLRKESDDRTVSMSAIVREALDEYRKRRQQK